MVLVPQLNSKGFNCIQAGELTEIGSHVILIHHMKSKDFNCIQAAKLTESRVTCGACSSAEF